MKKRSLLMLICAIIITASLFSADRSEIFAEKGNEAYEKDRYEIALRFYDKAIEEGNEDAIIWYRRAYCVEQIENFDAAWWHYWEALKKLRDQNREHRYFGSAKAKILSDENSNSWNLLLSTDLQLWEEAEEYLETADDIDISYNTGPTPLWIAIDRQNSEFARKLLNKGADPDVMVRINNEHGDSFRINPLGIAAYGGTSEIIQPLIDAGAEIDEGIEFSDKWGTALTFAIENDHTDIALTLIDNGADPNHEKYNPLFPAIANHHNEVVEKLLSFGNDPDVRRQVGRSYSKIDKENAVTYSILKGNTEALKLLLDYAASLEVVEELFDEDEFYRASPVFAAIHTHNLEGLKALSDYGADIESPAFGQDVLTHAAAYGNAEILDYLLQQGVEQQKTGEEFLYCPDYPFESFEKSYNVSSAHRLRQSGIRRLSIHSEYGGDGYDFGEPTLIAAALDAGNIDTAKYLVEKKGAKLETVFSEVKGTIDWLEEHKIQPLRKIINSYYISQQDGETLKPSDLDEEENMRYETYTTWLERFKKVKAYVEEQLPDKPVKDKERIGR